MREVEEMVQALDKAKEAAYIRRGGVPQGQGCQI